MHSLMCKNIDLKCFGNKAEIHVWKHPNTLWKTIVNKPPFFGSMACWWGLWSIQSSKTPFVSTQRFRKNNVEKFRFPQAVVSLEGVSGIAQLALEFPIAYFFQVLAGKMMFEAKVSLH